MTVRRVRSIARRDLVRTLTDVRALTLGVPARDLHAAIAGTEMVEWAQRSLGVTADGLLVCDLARAARVPGRDETPT